MSYVSGCGSDFPLQIKRVADHPLRRCYPYGAHDLALTVPDGEAGRPPLSGRRLRELVSAVLAADPHCRRVVAGPAEDATAAHALLEAAGFRRVTEADVDGGTVVLFVTEPPEIADLPTSLGDMPH